MLLSSVILVLREVLEAAVLISVLLVVSRTLSLRGRWWLWSILPAALGIAWYASSLGMITDAVDGAGQELANASLQVLVFSTITGIVFFATSRGEDDRYSALLQYLLAGAVVCAVVREGAEIFIYISGFAVAEELRAAVFTGSAIGAGIGVSIGILLYFFLRSLPASHCLRLCVVLLCLIGAGMVTQASMLLEQVDWLPSGQALWDSSGFISEQSIAGELLYAVFGYESSPSIYQVMLYIVSFGLISGAWLVGHIRRS